MIKKEEDKSIILKFKMKQKVQQNLSKRKK